MQLDSQHLITTHLPPSISHRPLDTGWSLKVDIMQTLDFGVSEPPSQSKRNGHNNDHNAWTIVRIRASALLRRGKQHLHHKPLPPGRSCSREQDSRNKLVMKLKAVLPRVKQSSIFSKFHIASFRRKLNKPRPNTLESLPPELRLRVLASLGLDELRALIFASPVFYQQFLVGRRYLRCRCLETTLGVVAPDAYAVSLTMAPDFRRTRTKGTIKEFLNVYQDQHSSVEWMNLSKLITDEQAVHMISFYFAIILPIIQYYTAWALENLAAETDGTPNHAPLSRTEKTRLMRGLYRLQLFCNLVGVGFTEMTTVSVPHFNSVYIHTDFLCIFEPWEVEEIACIHAFARGKYEEILIAMRSIYDEKDPRFSSLKRNIREALVEWDFDC